MTASGQPSLPSSTTVPSFPKSPTSAVASQTDAAQSKRDLASWWKTFKRGNARPGEQPKDAHGIFGIPLATSIRYANVAISLFDENGQSYIYGYVPIVVAKCGVYLKEKATETEGIFRLAGSEKRIKELKIAFDSPEKYGKGLDWTGYTVHDAANLLRRYINQLPEPIIPLDFYERFRAPLRNYQQQIEAEPKDIQDHFDPNIAIKSYQRLITELPPLNRQLLLYTLDLLAVFASKADLNKMTTPNLSAIFQPGILSHPQHDMAPEEYRLSQDVLIFLIENQDSFLIGMHGTAADEKTVQEVQSGYPAPIPDISPSTTPTRSRTVVGRASSNASGNSQGRSFSGLRRNLSSSSRTSRKSGAPTGGSPLGSSAALSSGLHRSNTVPSQRGIASSPQYGWERGSGPSTPGSGLQTPTSNTVPERHLATVPDSDYSVIPLQIQTPASPGVLSASSNEAATPLATAAQQGLADGPVTAQSTLLTPDAARRETSAERTRSRNLLDRLRQTPATESEKQDQAGRQPRKLQKKRLPGSNLSSAASSANDLREGSEIGDFVATEGDSVHDKRPGRSTARVPGTIEATPQKAMTDAWRPASPHLSLQSASVTDASEGEYLDDSVAAEKQEKKRRWRFSHSAKSRRPDSLHDSVKSTPPIPSLGGAGSAVTSPDRARSATTTSTTYSDGADASLASDAEAADLHESEDRRKGPMSWIKGKIQERKEKEAERRAKSPSGSSEAHAVSDSWQLHEPTKDTQVPATTEDPRSTLQHLGTESSSASTAASSATIQPAPSPAADAEAGAGVQIPGEAAVSTVIPASGPLSSGNLVDESAAHQVKHEISPTAEHVVADTPPASQTKESTLDEAKREEA